MKLIRFRIDNILGIEQLECGVQGNIEISGANASGKTSILEAFEAAFGGGNRAELIRHGADKAEAVFVFDTGHTVRAVIKPSGTTRQVTISNGEDKAVVASPAKWIEKILNPLSFNPVDFIHATNAERVKMLLKVTPMSVSREQIAEAVGRNDFEFSELEHPLKQIEKIHKSIYEKRTGLNALADDKRGYVATLKATPGLDAVYDDSALADLNGQKNGLQKALEQQKKLKTEEAGEEKIKTINAANADIKTAEEIRDKLIQECRDECENKTKAINARKDMLIEQAANRNTDALQNLEQEYGAKIGPLLTKIGEANIIANQRQAVEATKKNIALAEKDAEQIEASAKAATVSLKKLEAMKAKLIETLPVPDMEVKDGELFFEGVPYQTTNSAMQARVALRLAAAIAGEFKLILMDGMERMDAEQRAAFMFEAKQFPECQFVLARVVDGQTLTVESNDDGQGTRPDGQDKDSDESSELPF